MSQHSSQQLGACQAPSSSSSEYKEPNARFDNFEQISSYIAEPSTVGMMAQSSLSSMLEEDN
jgi:hypothetical protein